MSRKSEREAAEEIFVKKGTTVHPSEAKAIVEKAEGDTPKPATDKVKAPAKAKPRSEAKTDAEIAAADAAESAAQVAAAVASKVNP